MELMFLAVIVQTSSFANLLKWKRNDTKELIHTFEQNWRFKSVCNRLRKKF